MGECMQCASGAWECGDDPADLCLEEARKGPPWTEVGILPGPPRQKVYTRMLKGKCQVRIEEVP